MARLRPASPINDESSDDTEFCPVESGAVKEKVTKDTTTKLRSSPRKAIVKSYINDCSAAEDSAYEAFPVRKAKTPIQHRARQIRLAPLAGTHSSRLFLNDSLPRKKLLRAEASAESRVSEQCDLLPSHREVLSASAPETPGAEDDSVVSEAEESIWCGSDGTSDDSEEELPSPRKFLQLLPKRTNSNPRSIGPNPQHAVSEKKSFSNARPHDLHQILKRTENHEIASSRPTSSSDKENNAAFLRYSPPRISSPRRQKEIERPITPPQSPSKSRLQSPSKTKSRVATPPHRQSLDVFWSSNAVNDWNDQYSPQKILKSPKKLKFLRIEATKSPTSSPRKIQSPSKATRIERDAKKDFHAQKRAMAEAFFDELDQVVTGGKIKELASSAGGVRFLWSKTLNSTAGRANWRKETSTIRLLDGTTEIKHKHYASIELAEKVIDGENRLLNVIAHEFCHLVNFMVSGIKDQPHGRQFKAWGRICTEAFKHQGVEVTTKHSYEIQYKYIWQCSNEDCAVEFKRHSKSIDPKRDTCGACRSKLIQIKPTPRRDAGTATGYAAYVKLHFAAVKRSMPQASQKEVMEAVGRKYRSEKSSTSLPTVDEGDRTGEKTANGMDAVLKKLEVIALDDD